MNEIAPTTAKHGRHTREPHVEARAVDADVRATAAALARLTGAGLSAGATVLLRALADASAMALLAPPREDHR